MVCLRKARCKLTLKHQQMCAPLWGLIFEPCSYRPWVILTTWNCWGKGHLVKWFWWRRRPRGCTMPWKSSAKKSSLQKLVSITSQYDICITLFWKSFCIFVWGSAFIAYTKGVCVCIPIGWGGTHSYRKQSSPKYAASLSNGELPVAVVLRSKMSGPFSQYNAVTKFCFLPHRH